MVGFQSKSFDTIKDGILAKEIKKVEWLETSRVTYLEFLGSVAGYVA